MFLLPRDLGIIFPHEVSEGVRILRLPNGSVLTSSSVHRLFILRVVRAAEPEGAAASLLTRRRLRPQVPSIIDKRGIYTPYTN